MWESSRQRLPNRLGHHASPVELHALTHYLPEQTRFILDDNGHKICTRLRVVESFQADGPAAAGIWVVVSLHLTNSIAVVGAHKGRPYGSANYDHTVNMIWHDRKRGSINAVVVELYEPDT